jgi:hypothetical protein
MNPCETSGFNPGVADVFCLLDFHFHAASVHIVYRRSGTANWFRNVGKQLPNNAPQNPETAITSDEFSIHQVTSEGIKPIFD